MSSRVLGPAGTGFLAATLVLAACAEVVSPVQPAQDGAVGGTGGNPTNSPPQIATGPTAMPSAILDDETSSISVVGFDEDGDTLTFDWSVGPEEGSVSAFTVDGNTGTATYTPPQVSSLSVYSVTVSISDGTANSQPSSVNVTVTPSPAVILNDGEPTLWTARLTKLEPPVGFPPYSPLEIFIEQDNFALFGSNSVFQYEFEVTTTGTIDGFGNVSLTCDLDSGGDGTYTFEGTVSGSGSNQTIEGTYDYTDNGVSPNVESGTFTMDHN